MTRPVLSLINEHSFHDAWKLLLEQLEQIVMPKECKNCQYEGFCARCPGILAAECGDCSSVNEAFCNNAKKIYEVYWEGKGGKNR